MVPAGADDRLDLTVSSNDASSGAFEITQDDLVVLPLDAGDVDTFGAVVGSIDEPGDLAVYSLDVGAGPAIGGSGSAVEIDVTTPESGIGDSGVNRDSGLDAEIEVIDPGGASTTTDLAGRRRRGASDHRRRRWAVFGRRPR